MLTLENTSYLKHPHGLAQKIHQNKRNNYIKMLFQIRLEDFVAQMGRNN
jgi:hypothetical protein